MILFFLTNLDLIMQKQYDFTVYIHIFEFIIYKFYL
jgi:hypothetical protein